MRNNNGNVNTPRRRNILNELVDDSDTNLDDEEDEEDETSSEDDLNRVNQVLADQVQGVRHRPNSLITLENFFVQYFGSGFNWIYFV